MSCERCGAAVLAAGEARRFGGPKLLMPFGDSTILGSVIQPLVSADMSPIVVVLGGPNATAIRESLSGQPVRIVLNPNPEAGMVSSIRVGVEALPASLDRFIVALGDQPRIRAERIAHLVAEQSKSGQGIAIPTYQGRRGHPVVFDIRYRQEILTLTDRQTLRDLIVAHQEDIVEVECESSAYVSDIDTREEYEHELQQWHAEE